jgi:putative ABC transport system permease protein
LNADKEITVLGYFLELAIRSLRRNLVLSALMVTAVGVGIGACMTVLTTLVAMSGNPIPDKSSQLYVPSIDVWGPGSRRASAGPNADKLPDEFTYRDAAAFMKARVGTRQAAMYAVALNVSPPDAKPFEAQGRATFGDFFSMFEVPFRSGAGWEQREDDGRTNVVVLASKLADRVFPRGDAVGKTISLSGHDYRVVGVIRPWTPTPRFYDPKDGGAYSESEEFYLPFSTAIDRQMLSTGSNWCNEPAPAGWEGHLNSQCVWLQFWVELPTPTQVRNFKTFLQGYAAEQQRLGRFHWSSRTQLHDLMAWLEYENVVPAEVRANVTVAAGFLVVCLVNAVGLMLAKFASCATELALRRALGASRRDVFLQCMAETLLLGLLGGGLGLVLTAVGLSGLRTLLAVTSPDSATGHLVTLNADGVLITLGVAVVVTVCCGLYPTLRASRIVPGLQLKAA